jgi:hypothetical protein
MIRKKLKDGSYEEYELYFPWFKTPPLIIRLLFYFGILAISLLLFYEKIASIINSAF